MSGKKFAEKNNRIVDKSTYESPKIEVFEIDIDAAIDKKCGLPAWGESWDKSWSQCP